MKKFLVFLVSIIVAICLGMTFYYFAKDEEVIKIQTSTLYLNIGDSVSLDDLGFSHTHKKQETKINFNAGGEAVTSIINYDKSLKKYITSDKGGSATIVISTNNKKFKKFFINVIVGNGSEETPFQIKTEEDLYNIGTSRFMNIENADAHYIMMNDITLTKKHDAIGKLEDGTFSPFQGNFNGNYYIINNLDVNENIYGGLFGIIGKNATVKNLYIKNAKVEGEFSHAGTLAGLIEGYVDRIGIIDSVVNNSYNSTSYTGGLAGKIKTDDGQTNAELPNIATAMRVSIESSSINSYVNGLGYVGGIAGEINDAMIEGIKVQTNIFAPSNSNACGGFAGYLVLNSEGFVRESYSMSNIDSKASLSGALFGQVFFPNSSTVSMKKVLLGLYYDSSKVNSLTEHGEINRTDFDYSTVSGLNQSKLITSSSYIYYYATSGDDSTAVYWRDSIWKRVDGQYPILRYTDYAIPTNVSISAGSQDNTTNPDNPTNPDDPIDNPDTPNGNNTVHDISSAETLKSTEFKSNNTYRLTNDINLNGCEWVGKKLPKGAIFEGNNHTISNFTIKRDTNYVGFFSSVSGAVVNGVSFENVKISTQERFDYAGIVAGVLDNGSLLSINLKNIVIEYNGSLTSGFAGGLFGYSTKRSSLISLVDINNVTISGNINYVGGLAGYIGQNSSVTKANVTTNQLNGNAYVGGIAGQNDGSISDNTKATTNILANYSANGVSYIGGLVGANCNQVSNSEATVNISVSNSSVSHLYYVGGLAGFNRFTNSISNCSVYGNDNAINVTTNNGTLNIGGLVGLNAGTLANSYNKISSIGTVLNNVITAGLVAQNNQGSIKGCLTLSNLFGNEVGGLVTANLNGASISESAIGSNDKRVVLKGNAIAGLVYYSASGQIKNCYANVTAHLLDLNGSSAGAVLYFPVNAVNGSDYCTISHCIISCEFTGIGNKNRYLVTPANIYSSKSRVCGTLQNCIFDIGANGAQDAITPSGKSSNAVSKSSYSTSNSTTVTLISATQFGFDISNNTSTTWYYDANRTSLPLLSKFV